MRELWDKKADREAKEKVAEEGIMDLVRSGQFIDSADRVKAHLN